MAPNIKQVIPLFNRILVKKIVPISQTKAGIVLPNSKEHIYKGAVIAVGPGSIKNGKKVPVTVKIGDVVLIPDYSGSQVEVDSEDEYVMIREPDILCKVKIEDK